MFEQALSGADEGVSDALHNRGDARVSGVAATQAATTTAIQPRKFHNPSQLLSLRPLSMWLRLVSRPVVKTRLTWITVNSTNQVKTRKCTDRAVWMLSTRLSRLKRVDSAGDIPSPVINARGAATKTVTKSASSWSRCTPASGSSAAS